MRASIVCLVLAAGGCTDHRTGFFGHEEGSDEGQDTTTGPDPTTVTTVTTVGSITTPTSEPPPGPTTTVDPSGPGTVTITTTPTTDPTDSETDGALCGEEAFLPPEVPISTIGSNAGHPDQFTHACVAGGSAPDAVWLWTAPFDGLFEFNTAGSNFDTVMTVIEGLCGGTSLGCNDDDVGLSSKVTAKLAGGAQVTIAVEGLGGAVGDVQLNIVSADEPPPPTCAAIDLGSEFVAFAGSTFAGTSENSSGCGGDVSPELVFTWRAPFFGTFIFRTTGSSYDPLMYIRRGDCDGPEIGCSDDFENLEPRIDLLLGPDDGPVFIFVDGALGGAGDFTLEVVPF